MRMDRSVKEYKFVNIFIKLWIYQRREHFGYFSENFYEKEPVPSP
jgi:hypothetical protein